MSTLVLVLAVGMVLSDFPEPDGDADLAGAA
jgi:hypothetical protein